MLSDDISNFYTGGCYVSIGTFQVIHQIVTKMLGQTQWSSGQDTRSDTSGQGTPIKVARENLR